MFKRFAVPKNAEEEAAERRAVAKKLAQTCLFQNVDPRAVAKVAGRMERVPFRPGERLGALQDEPQTSMYVVTRGSVVRERREATAKLRVDEGPQGMGDVPDFAVAVAGGPGGSLTVSVVGPGVDGLLAAVSKALYSCGLSVRKVENTATRSGGVRDNFVVKRAGEALGEKSRGLVRAAVVKACHECALGSLRYYGVNSFGTLHVVERLPAFATTTAVSHGVAYRLDGADVDAALRQHGPGVIAGLCAEIFRMSETYEPLPLFEQPRSASTSRPSVAAFESYYAMLNTLLNSTVSTVADAPATMFPNMTVQIPTRMLYINGFKLLRQAFDDALRSDDRETHAYESLIPALLPGVLMTPVSSILEACNAEYANPEPLLRRAARGATFRCGREVIFGLGLNNLADYCEERVPRDVANSKLARNALGSGKTRQITEDDGADKNRLDKWKKEVSVLVAVAWARCRVLALRFRAYAATPRGKRGLSVAFFVCLALLLRGAGGAGSTKAVEAATEVPWSDFLGAVERKGRVADVVVSASRYEFVMDGARCFTVPAQIQSELAQKLMDAGITWSRAKGAALTPARAFFYLIAGGYCLALFRVARQMTGGGVGSVGRRRRAAVSEEDAVTFEQVAGIDAAKREVAELVEMTTNGAQQRRYAAVGARAPRGVMLVGPPGTGKTLLARALANAARVPFISCSGSEFVEMFVGRGAARVRQLFAKAAKLGSCVIFIDEIDALGKARRESNFAMNGANDEVEQTLNQLLACMDGVVPNDGVVVLAATNRLSVLDPALVRPGRFDRIVRVPPPDLVGREQILRVHAQKVAMARDVDLGDTARETKGLVGAELAAIVNEAAVRAVRRGSDEVSQRDMKDALVDFALSRPLGGALTGLFKPKDTTLKPAT
ncbi:metalloendopeptidase [Aureococcus anophagefferens]|nr:metalloendopeptidase [Aureococcus anophagefferens]